MRRFTRDQAEAYLQARGFTLGNYGGDDRNANPPALYDEKEVFNFGGPGGGRQVTYGPSGETILPPKTNPNTALLTPFVANLGPSQQIMPTNFNRVLLLIQNLSTADNVYFNLGSGSSPTNGIILAAGQGIVFDWGCPNNSVFVIGDAASVFGVVLEVTRTG